MNIINNYNKFLVFFVVMYLFHTQFDSHLFWSRFVF